MSRRLLACRLGLHRYTPWRLHKPCVFVSTHHLTRNCLKCPKTDNLAVPREVR